MDEFDWIKFARIQLMLVVTTGILEDVSKSKTLPEIVKKNINTCLKSERKSSPLKTVNESYR